MMSRPGTGTSEPLCATQFSLDVCGAASYPQRRVDGDVVALDRPRPGTVSGVRRVDDPIHDALHRGPQRGAIGAGRCPAAPARLDDAVEPRGDEARPQDDFRAAYRRG